MTRDEFNEIRERVDELRFKTSDPALDQMTRDAARLVYEVEILSLLLNDAVVAIDQGMNHIIDGNPGAAGVALALFSGKIQATGRQFHP